MLEIIYLGIIAFIVLLEIIRKKQNKFDFLTLLNIIFSIAYPYSGFLLTIDNINNLNSSIIAGNITDTNNIQVPLAIFVAYFLVFIGFYAKSPRHLAKNIMIKTKVRNQTIIIYAIFLLLISTVSIYIYSSQYGGLFKALSDTSLIRAGAIERGSLSFFKRFLLFSFFSSYLLASILFIEKIKKNTLAIHFIFILSLILSLISLLLVSTRAILLRGIIIFYLVYIIRKGKTSIIFILVFIIVSSLFIFYGKELFGSLAALPDGYDAVIERFQYNLNTYREDSSFSLKELSANFTFPFVSIYAAFNIPYEMRLFIDWFYGFASLMPDNIKKILEIDIDKFMTASYLNTYYIVNTNDYEIPTGFIAGCIYSMSWPGIIIFSFIYGWIGRFLQDILWNSINNICWMPFLYVLTALVWSDFMAYGDTKVLLQTHFWYFLSTLILLTIGTKISFIKTNHI